MTDIAAGDVVKCIDDTPTRPESRIMPDPSTLYIVDSIRPVGDGWSVRLRELAPSCHQGGACACGGCGWDAARFRRIYRPDPNLIANLLSEAYEPDGSELGY
jgi:hypothetical protein